MKAEFGKIRGFNREYAESMGILRKQQRRAQVGNLDDLPCVCVCVCVCLKPRLKS